jgi:histone H3/H4
MTPVHESEQTVESGQNSEDKKMSANEVARIVRQVLENSFDTVDENMIEEVLRRLLKVYTF